MVKLLLALAAIFGLVISQGSAHAAAAGKKLIIAYAAMNARVCGQTRYQITGRFTRQEIWRAIHRRHRVDGRDLGP